MGAARKSYQGPWKIEHADFMGAKHPYLTATEDSAKQRTSFILKNYIMYNLQHQAVMWGMVGPKQEDAHADFVEDAIHLLDEMTADLNEDRVWTAYHRFKEFEEEYSGEFPPFGLVGALGSVRVRPDPEPE